MTMRIKPHPKFHDGQLGAAFAVQVKVNAKATRIRMVDQEGTVYIDMADSESGNIDIHLKNYLTGLLGVKPAQLDVLGSGKTNARLVMVLGVTAEDLEEKINQSIS